jgi:hypothetical protein
LGDVAAALLLAPLPDQGVHRLRHVVGDETPAPEKIGRDIEAIEPVHVLGRVYAMQENGVHEGDSDSRRRIGQDSWPRCAARVGSLRSAI